MASDWTGVSIAPDDSMFEPAPTWVRLDSGQDGLRVKQISIERGKTSEFEQTGTGSCTVTFNDRSGLLDPTKASSTFYGKVVGRPFAISIRNPVTDEWFPLFRGHVDDVQHSFDRNQLVMQTVVTAVDMLDYLANFELIPGLAGFANAQLNSSGYVFYEDAGFDERINAMLGDVDWPVDLSAIFTGNVICQESIYSSGDKALQVLQEACDAEFPTIANYYVDKVGVLQVHGRLARFDPDTVSASAGKWNFQRWKVGDNDHAEADSGAGGTAKLQEPYSFSNSRSLIRNAALAYPQNTDQSDLSDYIYEDATSRAAYGTYTWTAENLQISEETTIGLTGKQCCNLFAQYIVENYKNPSPRIDKLTMGTERDSGVFSAATWEAICGMDISDAVSVTIDHPGGGGFTAEEYFVDGITIDITPGPGSLDNAFPLIKFTADVTPSNRWSANPFSV